MNKLKWRTVRIDIGNCARCGRNHRRLTFKPFDKGAPWPGYTHWGRCPRNGEPILMKITSVK